MLISHKHRFVFLATSHAASTSIGRYLAPHCDVESVHRRKTTADMPFFHHISARELNAIFNERGWDWDSYRRFCVVRNPFDRVVSWYHFSRRFHPVRGAPLLINVRRFAGWYLRSHKSFRDFVLGLNPERRPDTTLPGFIGDGNGRLLVNDILRFEELVEVLPSYLRSIGVPVSEHALPRLNFSAQRRDYRDYYDSVSRSHVESVFAYEIERFGYAF